MPVVARHMWEELAQSAFDLFAARGIRNVTLDDVAADAGVTKGSFYWHYKSKKELILATAALYYRDWHQRAHEEIAAVGDPLEQLRRVWQVSVDVCLFDRAKRTFSTEIFAMGLHDPEIRASWAQFYDSVRELYAGLIRAATNAGQLGPLDPHRTADWILATFEGTKHRASFQPQMCTAAERDLLVDSFMLTLRALSAAT
jgi:TetR/AcrR family transcriptional regulator, cholesterol catabolism regulator